MARKLEGEGVSAENSDSTKVCFVIMPISDVPGYPSGHFNEVYNQLIKPAVEAAGYECFLATSTGAAHMIQLEVVTKVATAELCVCDLSTNNPNVLFEYGLRQAFDKPTVLIKDDKTNRIFDLSGFRDIEYDHTLRISNTIDTREALTAAISDTVEGNKDSSQIFSLVKLMKLTQASLPTEEMTKDEARFKLLENKIDNIAFTITTNSDKFKIPASDNESAPLVMRIGANEYFRFYNNKITYGNSFETKEIFHSVSDLENSDIWDHLPSQTRRRVIDRYKRMYPDFPLFS